MTTSIAQTQLEKVVYVYTHKSKNNLITSDHVRSNSAQF